MGGVKTRLQLVLLAPLIFAISACGTLSGRSADGAPPWKGDETLTRIVTELRMHLREDPYRFPRPQTTDGRDGFSVLLWKLDRLKQTRNPDPSRWENVDLVIEFARGRALERLRRYAEASVSYGVVADSGSVLADLASDGAEAMHAFAELKREPELASAETSELELIQARIRAWRSLAAHYRGTHRSSLAWEEVEAWQILRVDWLSRNGEADRAIVACKQMIEHNRDSKLYARHLLRLGDLYADAARRARLHEHARLGPQRRDHYENLLENAFASYELAGEARAAGPRREAETRIAALIAFHERSGHHGR